MKQLEDNKTPDMFLNSQVGAALSSTDSVLLDKPSLDNQIAKAINNHVKYVNSFSQTGSWSSKRGDEYWSASLNKHIYEPEVKRLIRSHMDRTLKKIKEITK